MVNENNVLKRVLDDLLNGVLRTNQEVVTRLKDLKTTPGIRQVEVEQIEKLLNVHSVFGLAQSEPVSAELNADVWINLIKMAIEKCGNGGNDGAPPPPPPPGPGM